MNASRATSCTAVKNNSLMLPLKAAMQSRVFPNKKKEILWDVSVVSEDSPNLILATNLCQNEYLSTRSITIYIYIKNNKKLKICLKILFFSYLLQIFIIIVTLAPLICDETHNKFRKSIPPQAARKCQLQQSFISQKISLSRCMWFSHLTLIQ